MRHLKILALAVLAWPLMTAAHARAEETAAGVTVTTPVVGATADANVKHPRRHEMHEKWKSMTPEQREQFKKDHPKAVERFEKRKEMREKWQSMTPEQKAAKKAEMKAKWDAKTPEEKARWKANHPHAVKRFEAHKAKKAAAQNGMSGQ